MFYFFFNFSVVKVQHYHMCVYCIVNVIFSVVEGYHFSSNDADPDPDQTCHFDANPDLGLDSGLASK
jgi:hypothetical protein